MGKLKPKRKKRSKGTDFKAIYNRGMQLYLEEENYVAGLKYLYAYDYGMLLIEERGDIERGIDIWTRLQRMDIKNHIRLAGGLDY